MFLVDEGAPRDQLALIHQPRPGGSAGTGRTAGSPGCDLCGPQRASCSEAPYTRLGDLLSPSQKCLNKRPHVFSWHWVPQMTQPGCQFLKCFTQTLRAWDLDANRLGRNCGSTSSDKPLN